MPVYYYKLELLGALFSLVVESCTCKPATLFTSFLNLKQFVCGADTIVA